MTNEWVLTQSGGMKNFRFGLVSGFARTADEWTGLARQAERNGFSTLLMPDGAPMMATLPALAAAATATTDLHVGSFVLAAPFRPVNQIVQEAGTMALLTGDRFELGLGAGRPGAEADAEVFGLPYGTPRERIERIGEVIDALAKPVDGLYGGTGTTPRVLVAGGGPRMLAFAAAKADTIAFGIPPLTDDAGLAERVRTVRDAAGERFDRLELCGSVQVVGDDAPEWLAGRMGVSLADLRAAGSVVALSGTPRQMADVLERRRDELGISYVTVPSPFVETFAPVVELLKGR